MRKGRLLGTCAEPRYEVPLAVVVEVTATGRLHISEGNRLEHSNTTPMMPHMLDIDVIQILFHGGKSNNSPPGDEIAKRISGYKIFFEVFMHISPIVSGGVGFRMKGTSVRYWCM